MNKSLPILLVIIVLLFNPFQMSTLTGQDAQLTPRLFIGGGALSDNMMMEFTKLAGSDAKLVVIPTATSREVNPDAIKKRWQDRGIKEVSVLHTRDRQVSKSPEFIKFLKTATAVWISGGSQWRIAESYLDTPVEEELYKLIQRGGIIGGSSAGAAIMTRVMIKGGKTEPDIATGLNLVPGVILDQHFLKRNRLARLMAAVEAHPKLVGLGIDEDTAIVITGKEAKVIGSSYVMRFKMMDGKLKMDAYEDGEIIPNSEH